jgi:RNA 2',3'-cyclic 3'-phosphodiesterase
LWRRNTNGWRAARSAIEPGRFAFIFAFMSIRLFAALALPDDTTARIGAIQRGVGGARWRQRANLHLTLRFFGEVQEPVADELAAELDVLAARMRAFTVQLKGAASFGGAGPHALVLKAEPSPALMKLAADCERVARNAGLKPETRKYAPHVTLAYLHNAPLDRVQAFEASHALFAPPPFRVEGFGLYSSVIRKDAPSHYRLEAPFEFGA